MREGKPLSPLLANIEPRLSCEVVFGDSPQLYVTREYHEAWQDELRRRWERDKAFARRICKEHGFDIDELARNAPEYAS